MHENSKFCLEKLSILKNIFLVSKLFPRFFLMINVQ